MKFKYIFLSCLLLILATGIAAVAAEQATIGDYTFTVPDEYKILNQTDEMVELGIDDDHAIVITVPDDVKDSEDFKKDLSKQGYEFIAEENYTTGDFKIAQYNFNWEQYQGFLYICDNGDDIVLINYMIPSSDDVPDEDHNPISAILTSLSDD